MENLIKTMDAKLSELRYSSETDVCSSIRIESKDIARGFGLALHMLKLHIYQPKESSSNDTFTCHICQKEGCGIDHDCI